MSENVNTTTNGTELWDCPSNPLAAKIGKTFAYCLIFLVSFSGNTVTGIIVCKTKTMRKPINFLILNMALSDLLFPIFLIPRVIQSFYTDFWLIGGPLGQALCKLVYFFTDVSLTVSIQSLVLIAVDRFGAVIFPLRSPLISSKMCPFFMLATWIFAMAIYSPYLLGLQLINHSGGLRCLMHWKEVFGESVPFEFYLLSIIVVLFFIPWVLIAILYIIIYLKLKSKKIPGAQSDNAETQRQLRERNVLKMAIAIVLGFAVCWFPLAIQWIFLWFASDNINIRSCGFKYLSSVAFIMSHANCAINPCICFIFSRNYRDGLKALVR